MQSVTVGKAGTAGGPWTVNVHTFHNERGVGLSAWQFRCLRVLLCRPVTLRPCLAAGLPFTSVSKEIAAIVRPEPVAACLIFKTSGHGQEGINRSITDYLGQLGTRSVTETGRSISLFRGLFHAAGPLAAAVVCQQPH